jgi:citrate synthase
MTQKQYFTAQEAADELGITLASLYAYVSRGMIQSVATRGDTRAKLYSTEDVERLKARKQARANPEVVAEGALHLGSPVLESAITLIQDGRLYYRGLDAVQLAATHTVEQVAGLIWTGHLEADTSGWFEQPITLSPALASVWPHVQQSTAFEQFQVLLPLAGHDDPAAYDMRPVSVAATGARILRLMTLIAAGRETTTEGIAETLAHGWGIRDEGGMRLLHAALILCADHELNVSAFTARCVASAHATPYAAVCAGLAALSGAKHGGHTERVEAFLREAGTPEAVYATMMGRLRRGESIPGFGHVLYAEGDPRGAALLRWLGEAYPGSAAAAFGQAAAEAAEALIGEQPTIDLALVILERALQLPRGSALSLFGMGRTIGWIGHFIEQYATERMIRPRARYVGLQPGKG